MKQTAIQFLDLRRSYLEQRHGTEQVFARVLESGIYILGPELQSFEREFAAAFGVPFAAGVGSGTDALTLGLEASRVITPGKQEEVITSSMSAAFTAVAICRAGAVPRFVDIDPITLQIDAARIESSISEKTRAIIPVHLYGHPCRMETINRLAARYGLTVIEDACQAHGSRLGGRALGAFGTAAAFSFYPTKNLGALGDGGMVVSADEDLIRRVRMLRHGGQDRSYHHALLGYCSRLDELQSAVLRTRLMKLEERNQIRRQLASSYDEAFSDLELMRLPAVPDFVPNRHLYPIRTQQRDALRTFLEENGIQTLVHYPIPLPFQPAFRDFVLPDQEFPVAQKAAQELLSLPLYPELREDELQCIIRAVRRFFRA